MIQLQFSHPVLLFFAIINKQVSKLFVLKLMVFAESVILSLKPCQVKSVLLQIISKMTLKTFDQSSIILKDIQEFITSQSLDFDAYEIPSYELTYKFSSLFLPTNFFNLKQICFICY
jgi:hypothetical protein